jgi:hypothetical protein
VISSSFDNVARDWDTPGELRGGTDCSAAGFGATFAVHAFVLERRDPMKTKVSVVIVAAVAAAQLAGCGTTLFRGQAIGTWSLAGAERVPAARGQVRVSKGEQGNNVVTLNVEHLARPGDAFPGTSSYVVWLIPSGDPQPQNVGALAVDADLKGELTTKTPFRSFDIVVTAENQPNVTEPSGNRAMTASVQLPS